MAGRFHDLRHEAISRLAIERVGTGGGERPPITGSAQAVLQPARRRLGRQTGAPGLKKWTTGAARHPVVGAGRE